MGAVDKFKNLFKGNDGKETAKTSAAAPEIARPERSKEKVEVEMFQKKIKKMMEDPKMAKKAALIIERMINEGKDSKK